ncbi:hypothetical protein KIN52_28935 (plasmid) [Klebsiella pneumoniae]|uniref:hypothetical protein n=1 Tax=Klebsiella pneumoniae TaxID=573 RepID=UPI00227AADEA|nr:hypothetical protein [Klebsiella pneumoniae]MCY3474823.1 hypothetical protein [Klebsiella pneumoniae]
MGATGGSRLFWIRPRNIKSQTRLQQRQSVTKVSRGKRGSSGINQNRSWPEELHKRRKHHQRSIRSDRTRHRKTKRQRQDYRAIQLSTSVIGGEKRGTKGKKREKKRKLKRKKKKEGWKGKEWEEERRNKRKQKGLKKFHMRGGEPISL